MKIQPPSGNKKFGKHLKALCKLHGLTSSLAAAKCGVSKGYWCHFEAGRRRPDADCLYAMAQLFMLPMDELYVEACPKAADESIKRITV